MANKESANALIDALQPFEDTDRAFTITTPKIVELMCNWFSSDDINNFVEFLNDEANG